MALMSEREFCPGCRFANRNHLDDCPTRTLRSTPKSVQGGDALDNQVERLTEERDEWKQHYLDVVAWKNQTFICPDCKKDGIGAQMPECVYCSQRVHKHCLKATHITKEEDAYRASLRALVDRAAEIVLHVSEGKRNPAWLKTVCEEWLTNLHKCVGAPRSAAPRDCPPAAPTEPSDHMQGGEKCPHVHMDGLTAYFGPGKFWRCVSCGHVCDDDGKTPDDYAALRSGAVPALPGTDAPTELPARPEFQISFDGDCYVPGQAEAYMDALEASLSRLQKEVAGLRSNLYEELEVVTADNFAEMQQRAETAEAALSHAQEQLRKTVNCGRK